MGSDQPNTQMMRTWYGLTAYVTLGPGFLHRAGFGRVKIPHPPIANWILRQGLPADVKRRLSFVHEFAHFQTAPVVLVCMAALLTPAFVQGGIGLGETLVLLSSTQAIWEILSEGLLIMEAPAAYRVYYDGIPLWPRVLFWSAGVLVASAGGVLLIKGTP